MNNILTTNEPEGATIPSLSLEDVCQYACQVESDADAHTMQHMLMAQYMQKGINNQELSARILGIPQTRKQLKREEQNKALHPQGTLKTNHLPPELRTPTAIQIWQVLYTEGLVDEECMTLRSRTESGIMAATIAKALGIRTVWVTFEKLWGINNLKSAHDKAPDYQKCWDFQEKLERIIQ